MKIVIIGGRGNGTVVASTIEDCKSNGQDVECIGFLNDIKDPINGYDVLGDISAGSVERLSSEIKFIFAMSNVKQAAERYNLLQRLKIPRDRFASIIHPTSVVSSSAQLGVGVVLMPFTLVSPNVVIGDHSQLYAQSFVGHDSILEEMVFVANNASVGGRVLVKTGSHVGSNSSLVERIELGRFAVVGLGSVVLHDVNDYEVVAGNPARTIRTLTSI